MTKKILLQTVVIALLLLLIWWQACLWHQSQLIREARFDMEDQIIPYGTSLTTSLNQRMTLLEALSTFVDSELNSTNPSLEVEFQNFSQGLCAGNEGIRSLVVAPGGVYRYVHPLEGNEFMLGHDLFSDPPENVRAEVKKAIESRRIVISSPHEMRINGLGVAARKAVFHNQSLWGLVVMVIDLPPVLDAAGLNSSRGEVELALKDSSGRVFYGRESVFDENPVIFEVDLGDDHWDLAGVPAQGWEHPILWPLRLFQGAGLVIVALIVALIYLVSSRQAYLTSKVEAGTAELSRELAERKRAEEALQEREERLRAVFEAAENVSFIITDARDPEPRVLEFSPGAEKIFGYRREEMIEKPVSPLHLPEDIAKFPQIHKKMREGKGGFSGTTILIRKNGEQFPALFSTYPMVNEKGEMYAALGVSIDITERRRMEEELLRAKEKAESSASAKAEFTANMSHEIRTPLNAVIGMTDLLSQTQLSAEQQSYVETIRNSGESLLSIVNEILDFSKIDAGKMEISVQPFDLQSCIESSFDLVASKASDKGLEMAYVIADDVPNTLFGDFNRLKQVLVNLLSNAVKFTPKGEVLIEVSSKDQPGAPELKEVHFQVKDTGIGISEEKMSRLFRPFSQVETALIRRYEGTGLGLVIAKKLVELMGGTIWAESQPGSGSNFHFTIKARKAPDSSDNLTDNQTQILFSKKKVLVASAWDPLARMLCRQLRIWSLEYALAHSIQEAVKLWREGSFDAAIIDSRLIPTEQILNDKSIQGFCSLPLVVLGQREPFPEISSKCLYFPVARPVESSKLLAALRRAMGVGGNNEAQIPRKSKTLGSDLKDVSILLAEDNPTNQKVAMSMLRHLGVKAAVASDGAEAVRAAERQHYDIVLMDVQMPEMDGLEATRQIREKLPPEKQPWIIAMTAYSLEGDREQCLGAGMNDYISKPVKLEELRGALTSYLQKPGRR